MIWISDMANVCDYDDRVGVPIEDFVDAGRYTRCSVLGDSVNTLPLFRIILTQ